MHTHTFSHIQLACTCFYVLGMHVILLNPCYYLSLKNKKMGSEVKELSQAPVEGLIWTLLFSLLSAHFLHALFPTYELRQ